MKYIKLRQRTAARTSCAAGILLLTVLAFAQPPAGQPTPMPPGTTLPSFPAPPSDQGTPPQPTPDPSATPVPSSGNTGSFSYAPSSDYDGVSVVYPNDGSGPLYVSTPFLETSLKSTSNDDVRLNDLKMYEQMTNRVAEQFSDQMYPDSSAGQANVQRQVIQGKDRDMIIEQDPKAGPYARVTITDKEGNVISESSMSAKMAAKIAGNPSADPDAKIDALMKSDFTLPEKARANFNGLSKQELLAIVAEKPELQKQDFIKMTRVFAAEKAKAQANAAAGNPEANGTSASRSSRDETPRQRRTDAPAEASASAQDIGSKPERAKSAADARAIEANEPTLAERMNNWNLPVIFGALLGIGAIGVFIYGLLKTRRG